MHRARVRVHTYTRAHEGHDHPLSGGFISSSLCKPKVESGMMGQMSVLYLALPTHTAGPPSRADSRRESKSALLVRHMGPLKDRSEQVDDEQVCSGTDRDGNAA